MRQALRTIAVRPGANVAQPGFIEAIQRYAVPILGVGRSIAASGGPLDDDVAVESGEGSNGTVARPQQGLGDSGRDVWQRADVL